MHKASPHSATIHGVVLTERALTHRGLGSVSLREKVNQDCTLYPLVWAVGAMVMYCISCMAFMLGVYAGVQEMGDILPPLVPG